MLPVCIVLFLLVFLLSIFANAFCFNACLGLLTQFVYFKSDFPSCAVHLMFFFLKILCPHHLFICKGYVPSGEIALKNNHYYYYKMKFTNYTRIPMISVQRTHKVNGLI